MILVFTGFSTLFALRARAGSIPDETAHFMLSRHFSTTWGIPPDGPETYPYGYIQHRPVMYYWINGRALNVLGLFLPSAGDWKMMVILRLVNVVYAILSVVFCYLLGREIIPNRWWPLLGVFFLTNTLMFVFLAGGINYDNLTNACCFAGIFFLARVFNGKNFYQNSVMSMICILAGALVKITVLPLAVILFFIWVFYVVRNRSNIDFKRVLDWKLLPLFLLVFIALVWLNFSVYGLNIIKYRSLSPACQKIYTMEQCRMSAVVRRDERMGLAEPLTLPDVIKMGKPDPVEWFFDFWQVTILAGIYGIKSSIGYSPDLIITFFRLFYAWVIFIAIRYWKKPSFTVGSLMAILGFYTLVLLQTNYRAELSTDFDHLGIQGRYIFPVIGVLYNLIAYAFSEIPHKTLARVTAVLALLLFVWGGPLVALRNLSPITFPRPVVPADADVGEIGGRVEISQDFVSECSGTINQVKLYFGTYRRANTHAVTIRLTNTKTNRVLLEQVVPAKSIPDGKWFSLNISPFQTSYGDAFRIAVSSPDSVSGDAVTLWTSMADAYPAGQAFRNGNPTGTDLTFQYQCIQPLLKNLTYP